MTKTDLIIHPVEQLDRGLAYGEACFETFRVINGEIFMPERHFERLASGLHAFAIDLTASESDAIAEAVLTTAGMHGDDVVVRVTVTGGTAAWGLANRVRPEVYLQCMAFKADDEAIHLTSVEWPFALHPKTAKYTCDYAMTLRAMQGWRWNSGETPLICKDGAVLTAPTANVLILREGRWFTPGAAEGVLPGVIRSQLLEAGVVESAHCPVAWLRDCEAMMLTNSSLFAAAVSSVDGRNLDPLHLSTLPIRELLLMYPGVAL